VTQVQKVKARLTGYLGHESPDRAVLRSTLDALTGRLPSTAIFGGMLREFALGSARNFTSDIDLVSETNSHDIEQALRDFSPTRNKFGGFRFTAGKWRFDIWAFEDTWAFRQGLVEGNDLTDLFKTTFFNLDAALFHLGRRELCVSAQYEAGVLEHLLEINLSANPAPKNMARRAIRLAVERELAIGPCLAKFILVNESISSAGGFYATVVNDLKRHSYFGFKSPYTYRPQRTMEIPQT